MDAQFFDFIDYHSTCFVQSLRPSSGVQDRTYSIRCMSYRFVDYSLDGTGFGGVLVGQDRLCGLVVRVSGYRYRDLGFDSRRYQIF